MQSVQRSLCVWRTWLSSKDRTSHFAANSTRFRLHELRGLKVDCFILNSYRIHSVKIVIRPPDVSRKGLKFYSWTFFSFFLFYQSTMLSSHAVDGNQMYFRGSIVGKASTVDREISPTPPLIFTGDQKYEIWRRFQHHSTLSRSRSKMQQDNRTLKKFLV